MTDSISKTAMLTIHIDPVIKRRAKKLYSSYGLTVTDAINTFIRQSLIVGSLPFEVKDPFYKGELNIDNCSSKEMLDEPSIIDLKRILPSILKDANVKSLYLFGSRARGDNRPNSDYNFCYELNENGSLLDICGLCNDLEKLLGKEVDLTSMTFASNHFPEELKKDGILIYKDI